MRHRAVMIYHGDSTPVRDRSIQRPTVQPIDEVSGLTGSRLEAASVTGRTVDGAPARIARVLGSRHRRLAALCGPLSVQTIAAAARVEKVLAREIVKAEYAVKLSKKDAGLRADRRAAEFDQQPGLILALTRKVRRRRPPFGTSADCSCRRKSRFTRHCEAG
jgi:hypothetical protein